MRWLGLVLIPLIILLAQSPAFAPWHDLWLAEDGTVDKGQAAKSLVAAGVTAAAEAVAVSVTLSAPSYAILLAVSSVAVMIVVGDYIFALVFGTREAQGPFQLIVLTVLNLAVMYVMAILAGPKFFSGSPKLVNGKVTARQAFQVAIIPALLPTVYMLMFR